MSNPNTMTCLNTNIYKITTSPFSSSCLLLLFDCSFYIVLYNFIVILPQLQYNNHEPIFLYLTGLTKIGNQHEMSRISLVLRYVLR